MYFPEGLENTPFNRMMQGTMEADFCRSINPISTSEDTLCSYFTTWPTRYSDLPTSLGWGA